MYQHQCKLRKTRSKFTNSPELHTPSSLITALSRDPSTPVLGTGHVRFDRLKYQGMGKKEWTKRSSELTRTHTHARTHFFTHTHTPTHPPTHPPHTHTHTHIVNYALKMDVTCVYAWIMVHIYIHIWTSFYVCVCVS